MNKYKFFWALIFLSIQAVWFGGCSIEQGTTVLQDTPVLISPEILPTNQSASVDLEGGRLAYARETAEQRDIYLVNADGSNHTPLTNDFGWDNWPSWSPDGNQLAFTCRNRNPGLGGGICVIQIDGSNRVQLSNSNDWEPSWSPDGKKIVYISSRNGNPEVYLMNTDGSDQIRLTHDLADDWQPRWSPDSQQLVFVSKRDGDWEIYLMDVSDGGKAGDANLIKLTDNQYEDGFPDWSPDGTRIVFSSDRDGKRNIYIMNADGRDPQRITDSDFEASFPRWSPQGGRIAYTVFSMSSNMLNYNLAIMAADGSGQHEIMVESVETEECPNWQPILK